MKDKKIIIKCNIDCTILFIRQLVVIIEYFKAKEQMLENQNILKLN